MGYAQCHFFAGIGGWAYALRLAGWPDDRQVWTGSCPCQSFSTAGREKGGADERHLWPYWFHLIRECRPSTIFGEQVASSLALSWLDLVFDDLEAEGYTCGAADLPAGSVGAPHIRQRLWFVAHTECPGKRDDSRTMGGVKPETKEWKPVIARKTKNVVHSSPPNLLGHPSGPRCEGDGLQPIHGGGEGREQDLCPPGPGAVGELADSPSNGHLASNGLREEAEPSIQAESERVRQPQRSSNPWSSCTWLPCRDGKLRPTQSGLSPLAHGVSKRVPQLRAIGNSIVPQVAAEFIKAYMEEAP